MLRKIAIVLGLAFAAANDWTIAEPKLVKSERVA